MANELAFINSKGGCGKSTSVYNIAGVLSQMGEKVLVLDWDKQRNVSRMLMANVTEEPRKTVFDFLKGDAEPEECTAQALFQTRGNANAKYYGVDVMVGDVRMKDESALADVDGESAGARLKDFIDERGYTWLLCDMPPSNMTLNNICFHYFVNYAIIPFSSDLDSVEGYGDIMDDMAKAREVNPSLNVLGVYLARYMGNCGVDRYIREQLLKFDNFIDIQIPMATDVREAVMFGRPISYYKTFSKSRKAYEDLVDEIKERMNA